MSNILPKSSKVSYTQKLIVSKKFDNFAKITLRVTETGPSRINFAKFHFHLSFLVFFREILDWAPIFS